MEIKNLTVQPENQSEKGIAAVLDKQQLNPAPLVDAASPEIPITTPNIPISNI